MREQADADEEEEERVKAREEHAVNVEKVLGKGEHDVLARVGV